VSHLIYFYAECHYAECCYAECRYAEHHYAECRYAECRYAECHYAECRGAAVPFCQLVILPTCYFVKSHKVSMRIKLRINAEDASQLA
jgi:hypothetical protein